MFLYLQSPGNLFCYYLLPILKEYAGISSPLFRIGGSSFLTNP